MTTAADHHSKIKLLDAAVCIIRIKGYAATTLDDICQEAGVTKGSFFHHFKSKDELAVAAARHFSNCAEQYFALAPFHQNPDPVQRLLGYVDLRAKMLAGEVNEYTCLLGTLVQEAYATKPDIRAACDLGLSQHIDILTRDVEAAKQRYAPNAPWSAESVGCFIQSVLQGSFIFAKARHDPAIARNNLAHLRSYIEQLFRPAVQTG